MWRISHEQRVLIIRCLVEGMSMRGTSRVARVSINTVVRVLREIGVLADQYHHDNVVGRSRTRSGRWNGYCRKQKTGRPRWSRPACGDTQSLDRYGCGRQYMPGGISSGSGQFVPKYSVLAGGTVSAGGGGHTGHSGVVYRCRQRSSLLLATRRRRE